MAFHRARVFDEGGIPFERAQDAQAFLFVAVEHALGGSCDEPLEEVAFAQVAEEVDRFGARARPSVRDDLVRHGSVTISAAETACARPLREVQTHIQKQRREEISRRNGPMPVFGAMFDDYGLREHRARLSRGADCRR